VSGVLHQYYYFISPTWYNVYGYVAGENRLLSLVVEYGLMALACVGLGYTFRYRKEPRYAMVLWYTLGVILSIPFVSPVDADRMRAYAVVIPLFAFLPALGVWWIIKRFQIKFLITPEETIPGKKIVSTLAGSLLFLVLLAPVISHFSPPAKSDLAAQCPEGLSPVLVRIAPGTFLQIVPESTFILDQAPYFHASHFQQMLHNIIANGLVTQLAAIEPPALIYTGIDLLTRDPLWLVAPPEIIPLPAAQPVLFCGTWDQSGEDIDYNLFHLFRASLVLKP
jgi:hypothetical protein